MCHGRRVLVVEDTATLRMLLQLTLEDAGYTVVTAEHGAAALARLPEAVPCVILLDLRMPVMDGRAFARAYHQLEGENAHLIVLTAEAQVKEIEEIAPVHVVKKPFDLDVLVPIVEHWVRSHPPRSS